MYLRLRRPKYEGKAEEPPTWLKVVGVVMFLASLAISIVGIAYVIEDVGEVNALTQTSATYEDICSVGGSVCFPAGPPPGNCTATSLVVTQVPAGGQHPAVSVLVGAFVIDAIAAALFIMHWFFRLKKKCRKCCQCTGPLSAFVELAAWPFSFILTLIAIGFALTLPRSAISLDYNLQGAPIGNYTACLATDSCGEMLNAYTLNGTLTTIPLDSCDAVNPYYDNLMSALEDAYIVALPLVLVTGGMLALKIYLGIVERKNGWDETCGV